MSSTEDDGGSGRSSAPAAHHVTLVGRPGCHLCDQARAVVARVAAEVGATWEERSILDDPQLYARYWEQIPVTLVDGEQHDFWHVSADRLRKALTRSA